MNCYLFYALIWAVCLPQHSHGFQSLVSKTHQLTTASRQHTLLGATMIDTADALTNAQQLSEIPVSSLTAILTSSVIAPSPEALAQLQQLQAAAPAIKSSAATIQEMLPSAGDAMQAQAAQALDNGFKVMDATKFIHGGADKMPGFYETKSVVAPHVLPGMIEESVSIKEYPPGMFKFRMEYATTMLRAIQKLPYVAFGYALIEFFFLRNDVDIYKEDVEDDPAGVLAETFSDTTVRVAIFFGLALVTYVVS